MEPTHTAVTLSCNPLPADLPHLASIYTLSHRTFFIPLSPPPKSILFLQPWPSIQPETPSEKHKPSASFVPTLSSSTPFQSRTLTGLHICLGAQVLTLSQYNTGGKPPAQGGQGGEQMWALPLRTPSLEEKTDAPD